VGGGGGGEETVLHWSYIQTVGSLPNGCFIHVLFRPSRWNVKGKYNNVVVINHNISAATAHLLVCNGKGKDKAVPVL
jgi:hypothetical protein